MGSSLNGTGVTFSNGSTQTVAWPGNTGTVTSVATGNGLQGGTITSSGTLSIAAPGFNTVGSYVLGTLQAGTITAGNTYSAGSGANLVQSIVGASGCTNAFPSYTTNNLSGTWRYLGANGLAGGWSSCFGLFVRVA